MSAPVVIPDQKGPSPRPKEQHEALFILFIIEGRSAQQTAEEMRLRFPGTAYTRNMVGGYADRQAWEKGSPGGKGRVPPPEATAKRLSCPAGPLAATLADCDPVVGQRFDPKLNMEVDVRRKSCRWPVGPAKPVWRMSEQLFCGEASHGDSAYCLIHCCKAYPNYGTGAKKG